MADLSERLQSILDELDVSARELARRANLKSESHVGLMMKGTVTRPSAEILHAIAQAANVEPRWLESGEGPRRRGESTVVRDERYNVMPAIRVMAKADGFPQDFVQSFETLLDLDYQPTASELWDMFKVAWASEQRRLARVGEALPPKVPDRGVDPVADIDRPPTHTARKKR